MANSLRIKPTTRHWHLYQKRPYRTASLSLSQVAKRVTLLIMGAVVVALLGPFVPSHRLGTHLPATMEEYLVQLLPCSLIALLLAVAAGYEYIGKPLKNQRLGYRRVGQFVVRGKQQLLGSAWLELPPDDTHRVGVPEAVFKAIQKGDTVEVVYSATEDFVSVHKINPPAARA
ncbi:hypothetical protein Q5H92_26010 [Hymenobacter sp. M29]|uniref:NfeD-like C-terminal domain-containing protein n=1 Tax=Hymenobacter mellowenesis TaxID=3063995 RepID=A0ABT9AK64_9BACT|nr:hypothetical protein [Hymenobacter sp. M29]MDO7849842.1 hypothetical protein [Hymenobacter sp. M29]